MTADLDQARAFITALAGSPDARVTFQTFDDMGKRPDLARILHGTLDQHAVELDRLNGEGAGVFVCVNETDLAGRKAENVVAVRSYFADFDEGDPVKPWHLPPSLIVGSKGGPHVYWLAKPGQDLARFTEAQKRLAAFYGSDPKVCDLPRVMRLPGFDHRKGDPFRVQMMQADAGVRYDLADLLADVPELPEVTPKQTLTTGTARPMPVERLRRAEAYLDKIPGAVSGQAGHATTFRAAVKAIRGFGLSEGEGLEALRSFNARCDPPWSDRELAHKVREAIAKGDEAWGSMLDAPATRGNLALAPEPAAWPERRPLPSVSAVPILPETLLPEPLRAWLADVADRVSIPLEFVAAPALVGLGSVVGRGIAIRPMERDDFTTPANLWGGIVGPPGCMKSGAVDQALRPVERLAAKARAAFEAASSERDASLAEIEAKRKAAKGELERGAKAKVVDAAAMKIARDKLKTLSTEETEADVHERRYMTSDATIEKLGLLLNENPRGLLINRDELTGWLRGLDRDDRAQDRAFYLEAWNGSGSFTVDRIGRGTLHVPALTLSIVGGIQPGRLSTYVRGAVAGEEDADGLLQRFQLIVWPDEFGEWRAIDRWPDREARDRAFRIFEALSEFDPSVFGATIEEEGLPFLRFAPDAQGLALEWRTELERRLRGELRETPAFESHMSKYRSLLPKLAMIFHLVDVADGSRPGPVALKAAQLAASWCDFLEKHARKLYAAELEPGVSAAHALAARIERGHVADGVSIRDLVRREWPGLSQSGDVHEAASALENLGWLHVDHVVDTPTGGRPSAVIRLHPDLAGSA